MATTTAPPPAGRIDHQELRRFLNALRLQLWWRDALVFLAAGALAGALLTVLVDVWLLPVCVVLAAVIAVVRRPSLTRAARVADRQLLTASRLATSAEVLRGQLQSPLAEAQLEDAWRMASGVSVWRAFPRTWRRVQIAGAALAASIAVLALTATGVISPVDVPGLLGLEPVATDTAASSLAAQANDDSALTDAASRPEAQNINDLQAQAAQSEAAHAALQRLGDALRSTAAAGDVGDALRAGNYDDAMAKLNALGTQSDQLSRQSKRELGAALERAAIDSSKADAPLAVAEDRVARALNRNVYSETRSAMQDLSKAVGDARNGVISQEEMARELAQIQQQADKPTTPGGGGGDIGESEVGYIPDLPGEAPNGAGLVQGVSSTISVPGPEGDPNTSKRSSVGHEAGGDPFGDLTSRLDVSATDVSVGAQAGADQGRSGLKANPSAPVVKISDATQTGVTPSDVAQPSEPVRAATERDVEPSDQRTAVRSFFKPGTTAQTP